MITTGGKWRSDINTTYTMEPSPFHVQLWLHMRAWAGFSEAALRLIALGLVARSVGGLTFWLELRDSPSHCWSCHGCVKDLYLWQMACLQRRVFYSFLYLLVRSHISEFLTSEHSHLLYQKISGKIWHGICKFEKFDQFDLVCQGSLLHCR